MPKQRLLGLLVAALTIVPAAPALAGPTVSVRIEGQGATLLPAITVTLPDAKAPGNPCSGANAASTVGAAIEEATRGNWDRQDFTQTILGETHQFDNSDYWAEWVNEKFGGGVCNDVVQNGDRVLMLVDVSPPPSYSSTVFPLVLRAPYTVRPGAAFSVAATEYRTDGTPGTSTPTPASGVTVIGADVAGTTDADGRAAVRITRRGYVILQAGRSNGERSEPFYVCVTDGADGFCGTTKAEPTTTTTATTPPPDAPPAPVTPAPPAAAPPAPVTPASPAPAADKLAAFGAIGSITEGKRFAKGAGPRTLTGRVDADASGLRDVRLRLSRTDGKRCARYDGAKERFVTTKKCGIKNARTFSVGSGPDFSYLLPSALPRGRYVLDVVVYDRAGNQTRTYQRGRNRVVFTVG